jgi:hypothetical protein
VGSRQEQAAFLWTDRTSVLGEIKRRRLTTRRSPDLAEPSRCTCRDAIRPHPQLGPPKERHVNDPSPARSLSHPKSHLRSFVAAMGHHPINSASRAVSTERALRPISSD